MESWDVRRNSFVGWHPPVAPTAQILWEGRSGSGDRAATAGTVYVHLFAARNEGKRCRGARVMSPWKSINYTECTACIQACTRCKHERAARWDTHGDPIILLSHNAFQIVYLNTGAFKKKTFSLHCCLLIKTLDILKSQFVIEAHLPWNCISFPGGSGWRYGGFMLKLKVKN